MGTYKQGVRSPLSEGYNHRIVLPISLLIRNHEPPSRFKRPRRPKRPWEAAHRPPKNENHIF